MRRMYSKEELSKIIKEADFSGVDLKVKTIEQSEANYSVDFEPSLDAGSIANGLTLTRIYNRFEVIGNILYVVSINVVNNPTGSTVSYQPGVNKISKEVTLDPSIAEKIYDINGKKVSEDGNGNISVTSSGGSYLSGISYNTQRALYVHSGENKIRFILDTASNLSIAPNGYIQLFHREFFVLI